MSAEGGWTLRQQLCLVRQWARFVLFAPFRGHVGVLDEDQRRDFAAQKAVSRHYPQLSQTILSHTAESESVTSQIEREAPGQHVRT